MLNKIVSRIICFLNLLWFNLSQNRFDTTFFVMDSSHSFLLPHTDFLARNQYELVGQKEVAVNLSVEGNVTVQIRIALFGFVVYFYVSMFFLAYPLIIPFSNSLSDKKL